MTALLRFIKHYLIPVVIGIIIGGFVNYTLIYLSNSFVPEGVDPSDVESIKANIHRYSPFHLLFPFLAHAFGTFTGAFVTLKLSQSSSAITAYVIGVFFMIGGIMMVVQLPAPMWFSIVDLGIAYLPMAWIATKIAR